MNIGSKPKRAARILPGEMPEAVRASVVRAQDSRREATIELSPAEIEHVSGGVLLPQEPPRPLGERLREAYVFGGIWITPQRPGVRS